MHVLMHVTVYVKDEELSYDLGGKQIDLERNGWSSNAVAYSVGQGDCQSKRVWQKQNVTRQQRGSTPLIKPTAPQSLFHAMQLRSWSNVNTLLSSRSQ